MSRQHATPVHLADGASRAVKPTSFLAGENAISEAEIQHLVHMHPSMLPIREIDPMFADPIAICRELVTPTGNIDNLLITASGLPVLVECKLWRNPQARREVVGQILDYAKELSRWSSADLQREVSKCLKRDAGVAHTALAGPVDDCDPSLLFLQDRDDLHFREAAAPYVLVPKMGQNELQTGFDPRDNVTSDQVLRKSAVVGFVSSATLSTLFDRRFPGSTASPGH